MNGSHAAVGASAGGAVGIITGILAGTWHIDAGLAANWAMAICGMGGALWAVVLWWVKWKYPLAPALPGETVEIPPGTPASTTAVVQPPAQPQVPPPVLHPAAIQG